MQSQGFLIRGRQESHREEDVMTEVEVREKI